MNFDYFLLDSWCLFLQNDNIVLILSFFDFFKSGVLRSFTLFHRSQKMFLKNSKNGNILIFKKYQRQNQPKLTEFHDSSSSNLNFFKFFILEAWEEPPTCSKVAGSKFCCISPHATVQSIFLKIFTQIIAQKQHYIFKVSCIF